MKNLSITEKKVIEKVGYKPTCGELTWNPETRKYDIINKEYIKRCRARVNKLMQENDVTTPSSLLKLWERQKQIEGKAALEAFKSSPKFREMKKYPAYARIDILPFSFTGNRLSTSFIKMYKNKQGKLPLYIERVISYESYNVAPWGKLRKTYFGENHFYCEGIRTEDNGKTGMKKVVWHYADYYLAVNKEATKAFYKLANGESGEFSITKNGSFKFRGKIYKKPIMITSEKILKAHHIRRSAEKVIRGNVRFEWDRSDNSGMFVDNLNEEKYHFSPSLGQANKLDFFDTTFRIAISAFRRRRSEQARKNRIEKIKTYMIAHKNQIFVGIKDSEVAGNCRYGTESFATNTLHIDLQKIGGVSVEEILQYRNDSFTMRACIEATERVIEKRQIELS